MNIRAEGNGKFMMKEAKDAVEIGMEVIYGYGRWEGRIQCEYHWWILDIKKFIAGLSKIKGDQRGNLLRSVPFLMSRFWISKFFKLCLQIIFGHQFLGIVLKNDARKVWNIFESVAVPSFPISQGHLWQWAGLRSKHWRLTKGSSIQLSPPVIVWERPWREYLLRRHFLFCAEDTVAAKDLCSEVCGDWEKKITVWHCDCESRIRYYCGEEWL